MSANEHALTRGERTTVFALVGAGHFMSHVYILSLPPLFALIKSELEISYAALGLLVGLVLCWLLWVLPAAKQRRYWERSYFQLKQEQDAQTQAEDKSPQGVVKIP